MNALIETKENLVSPYIDEKVMDEFKQFMGEEGGDMVKELKGLYLTNTPKLISNIKKDIKARDMNALKTHVHGLKGSSAQLGVTGIASLSREIEEVIPSGRFDEIESLFKQLLNVFKKVKITFSNQL
jgi:HPt (histidine-containing phosphotransfer) domain-containing protein